MNSFQHVVTRGVIQILDYIVCAFWYCILYIPESVALRLSPALGAIIRINTKRTTLVNMRTVLEAPSSDAAEKKTIPWHSNATHVARTLIELIHLDHDTLGKLRRRVSINDEQQLRTVMAKQRGAMLFLNHLGNLGYTVGGLAAHGYDLTVIGNPVWIPFLERKLQHLHHVIHARRVLIGEQLPKTAAEIFRQNGIVATFIDYTVVEKHNAWLQLGQAKISINLGPAIIALRNKVDVLCISCLRNADGTHSMAIHPPLNIVGTDNIRQDAITLMQAAMNIFETELLNNPEQWWTWNYARIQ